MGFFRGELTFDVVCILELPFPPLVLILMYLFILVIILIDDFIHYFIIILFSRSFPPSGMSGKEDFFFVCFVIPQVLVTYC